jgi:LAO/AO transport system kinase
MSDSVTAQLVAGGDRRALARLLTAVESGDPATEGAITSLIEANGRSARRVGITGPPGAGKSTLVNAMVTELRRRDQTVAVLAVDPSSPITGGALLGDRIRMQGHIDDPGVFVRSMASRGHLGGLAPAAATAVTILANSGFDVVIVETVGVGQSEVEVMDVVDVVVLVLGPGWGDQIQASKAGIVEITDVFVINKGDRPGVDTVHRALVEALGDTDAPVLVTTAATGDGIAALVDAVR